MRTVHGGCVRSMCIDLHRAVSLHCSCFLAGCYVALRHLLDASDDNNNPWTFHHSTWGSHVSPSADSDRFFITVFHAHTHTNACIQTRTLTLRETHMHTHTYTKTEVQIHRKAQTHTHTQPKYKHTHTHAYSLPLSCAHTHTHKSVRVMFHGFFLIPPSHVSPIMSLRDFL